MSQFAYSPSRRSANCYQGPDKNKKRFRKPIKVSLTGNRLLAQEKKGSLTGYAACISRLGWDSMLKTISDVTQELPLRPLMSTRKHLTSVSQSRAAISVYPTICSCRKETRLYI
ncbi:hypothetical protein BV898_19396 [Hypsibius exemplaris]|uniref:Uncharacterized protein n=1 Tax=Hypsibius exemplaris TaxID=2072580 RepID=A0A9X6RPQ7_HYPEX|nr:hypothetical protein BV898_19396 [Hypsibius exemplaris]